MTLGTYPQIGLKLARSHRDLARQQLAEHKDPRTEHRRAQAARNVLFKDVAKERLTMMFTPPGRRGGRELTDAERAEEKKPWRLSGRKRSRSTNDC